MNQNYTNENVYEVSDEALYFGDEWWQMMVEVGHKKGINVYDVAIHWLNLCHYVLKDKGFTREQLDEWCDDNWED